MLRTAGSASIGATALFLALSAAAWAPAHAESSAPAIAAAWTIGDDFSNASCEADLSSEAGPKGARIARLSDCARLYPVLAPVRGWRPDGMGGIVPRRRRRSRGRHLCARRGRRAAFDRAGKCLPAPRTERGRRADHRDDRRDRRLTDPASGVLSQETVHALDGAGDVLRRIGVGKPHIALAEDAEIRPADGRDPGVFQKCGGQLLRLPAGF